MIKVKALREFTYGKFDKIKNLERYDKEKNKKGTLYSGDTFECTEEMTTYLTGGCGYVLVKIIEVKPEEVKEYPKAIIEVDSMAKEIFKEDKIEKPKKTTKKKK